MENKDAKLDTKNVKNIANSLRQKFGTNLQSVYLPCLNKKLYFKAITVGQQKTISKILIEAGGDSAKIYLGLLGMIQGLCTEPIDFTVMNEFERIKIMVELFGHNYLNEALTLTCGNCKHEFTHKINFTQVGNALDTAYVPPSEVELLHTTETGETIPFKFGIGYPMVPITNAYMAIIAKDANRPSGLNEEFLKLFINSIDITLDGNTEHVVAADCDITEFLAIIDELPVTLFMGKSGLMSIISERYFKKLDNLLPDLKCPNCASPIEGALSIVSFFQ